jgi:hypothetical protein
MGIGGLPMVSAASVFLYASVVMKASSVILASVFGINPDRKPERPHFSGVDGLAFSW